MVETPINMTESFQIYQKLKKKKTIKILGLNVNNSSLCTQCIKYMPQKKNVYPWEKLLRDWRLKR